ncbi:MAG: T9SS C-terminal target domain-containing protein [Ignavibacteriae bacterium]|nr:MAG: T9SS C-terminal target domain-containing protein [Ignavibacteriota bacterium]
MKTIINILFIIVVISCSAIYSQVYTWYLVNSGTTNNLNCIFGNFIAGDNGTLLRTSNTGNNWFPVNLNTTNDLRSICYDGSNFIIVVGESNTIYRSTNNGVNWSFSITGASNGLNSVTRAASSYYYAAGAFGTVLLTTNYGVNWTTVRSMQGADLNSISALGYYAWAVGNSGTIIYTTNWGANWVEQNSGTTAALNSIVFSNTVNGWIAGNNGTILHTTNGGLNWIAVNSGTTANLKAINASGWIAGDSGIILRSTNYGVSWTRQNTGTTVDLNSVYPYSADGAWTAGKNGKLYQRRYDSLFTTWKRFTPNNIGTYITNTGIFNQDIRLANKPGFEWPKGTGRYAIFTSGLCIAAMYNGILREAMASYKGEYTPGYIFDSSGISVARTDNRFRIYSVKRGDNMNTNQDWAEWGQMVPIGAPYVDVNGNNQYEPATDTPGIKGASQTIFVCFTDGFPETHTIGEGFGGGTLPLYAEVHLTAWGFNDKPSLENVQFLKWDVINKSKVQWQSTYFSIFSDVDLGGSDDDYIGCDTTRNLGYCYNSDDNDEGGYGYGLHPPAVGMQFLNCIPGYAGLSSFDYIRCVSCGNTPPCESDPNGQPEGAYNFMKGLKKDGTPWVIPPGGNSSLITKYVYSGQPWGAGWDESDGRIGNCGNSLTGPFFTGVPGDRRMIMNYGAENKNLNPGDTQKILIAQMIARGSSNLNSITMLMSLSDVVKAMCENGGIFGVKEISSQVPSGYKLYQNYPNPFNPKTIINYQIAMSNNVKLVIYDVMGKEIAVLVNQKQNAGTYEIDWDAGNYSSGVYFYSLIIDNKIIDSKKMLLIK